MVFILRQATDTSLCMTYIDNKIKLNECNYIIT